MKHTREARLLFSLSVLVTLATACGAATPPPPTATPIPPTPTPVVSGKVDIGGRGLSITCSGEGTPTVILESVQYGRSFWMMVQNAVSGSTRICSYSRAGQGPSDPRSDLPATTQDLVDDLHALLDAAHIPGPYVLVGYELGGFVTRLYASQYATDVAGMVLVDSLHPDSFDRLAALFAPEATDNGNPAHMLWLAVSAMQTHEPYGTEMMDWLASADQVRAVKDLRDLPLVVLSHGAGGFHWEEFGEEIAADAETLWVEHQADLTTLSTNSSHVTIDGCGHYGMPSSCSKPISEAILSVLAEVREE